jgi:hypothetical protein
MENAAPKAGLENIFPRYGSIKMALVSATSLAALLAFEVGLDVAIDAKAAWAQYDIQSFTNSPTSLNFGYVLLNTSGGTTASLTETVTNASTLSSGGPLVAPNTITFSAVAASPFSGSLSTVTLGTIGAGVSATNVYRFAPSVTGAFAGTATINSNATLSGASNNYATVVGLSGTAVAPVQQTTLSAFGAVRIGTTVTMAAITVQNVGNGDLASNTLAAAQLRGSIGAASSSVFTGSGGTFSLNDSHYTGTGSATTTAAFTYRYAPTSHTTSDSATVIASFTNGSSAGTNAAQTSTLALTGQGVGPEFQSKIGGTTYANSVAIGNATVAAGTISTGAYKTGVTTSLKVLLSNISTDVASASLTDLTLESFTLSGAQAADFSIVGFTTDTVLAEAQSVTVTLDFSGPTVGNYDANLSFTTDQGVALGVAGAVFNYALLAAIPEPATILTFGIGMAGLAWARRRASPPG